MSDEEKRLKPSLKGATNKISAEALRQFQIDAAGEF